MSEKFRECIQKNKLEMPFHKASDFSEGERVLFKDDGSDYTGERFFMGEAGLVVKVTRCTVHVEDSAGHVHKGRQASLFVKFEDMEKYGL